MLEKNSIDKISELVYSPTKQKPNNPFISSNKNSGIQNFNENPNELTSLLKKEISRQDELIGDFNLLAKSIKKTNIEVQNELIHQNKLLRKLDRDVNMIFLNNRLPKQLIKLKNQTQNSNLF